MKPSTFAPIILGLVSNYLPVQGYSDIYLAEKPPVVAQDDHALHSLAIAPQPSVELKLEEGKFPYDQVQSSKPKLSNLFALTDYVLGNKAPVLHTSYDASEREDAQRMIRTSTTIAKSQLSKQDIGDEEISQALSMLFESESADLLPSKLTVDQKAFFTRILFEAKKGVVDNELVRALEFLKEKPLTSESLAEYNKAISVEVVA